jgi:hypothetical protein
LTGTAKITRAFMEERGEAFLFESVAPALHCGPAHPLLLRGPAYRVPSRQEKLQAAATNDSHGSSPAPDRTFELTSVRLAQTQTARRSCHDWEAKSDGSESHDRDSLDPLGFPWQPG